MSVGKTRVRTAVSSLQTWLLFGDFRHEKTHYIVLQRKVIMKYHLPLIVDREDMV